MATPAARKTEGVMAADHAQSDTLAGTLGGTVLSLIPNLDRECATHHCAGCPGSSYKFSCYSVTSVDCAKDEEVSLFRDQANCLTFKLKSMSHTEVLDVRVKALRPKFKAGSELSGKVNMVVLTVTQTEREETESLDVDLKWSTELSSNCEE